MINELVEENYNLADAQQKSRVDSQLKVLIIVVTLALFLDAILVTVVVPILPQHFELYEHSSAVLERDDTRSAQNRTEFLSNNSTVIKNETTFASTDGATLNESVTARMPEESTKLGFLLGSKQAVHMISNLLVGPLTNKFGDRAMLFVGFFVMFTSTLIFAFGITYEVLFIARALQGFGSACGAVAGLAALSDRFRNDADRERAIGISLSGNGAGSLIGPVFGGILYDCLGKEWPFTIICGLIVIATVLLMFCESSSIDNVKDDGKEKPPTLIALVIDPYIILLLIGLVIASLAIALPELAVPIMMVKKLSSRSWQIGLVFWPGCLTYTIAVNCTARMYPKMEKWKKALFGTIILGVSLLLYPSCKHLFSLNGASAIGGFGIGIVESVLLVVIGRIVDTRHSPSYSSVFALANLAMCFGFGIGPMVCGVLLTNVGFFWTMIIGAILCFTFAPFYYSLKHIPSKKTYQNSNMIEREEKMNLNAIDQKEEETIKNYPHKNTQIVHD